MSSRNILFIVEGDSDEPDFLKQMFGICFADCTFRCWSYKTSLHDLVCDLYPDGEFDPDLDILLHLRSKARSDEERKILSASMQYTDVFMIFDFEPHYSHLEWERIREMLQYYQHSDDEGKLILNYPMMQSYKHLKTLPDDELCVREVAVSQAAEYKQLVDKESSYKQLNRYTYPVWMSICGHHLKKWNYIINNDYAIPDADTFFALNQTGLFDIECQKHTEQRKVDVVNTACALILEYEPVRVLEDFRKHKDRYFL